MRPQVLFAALLVASCSAFGADSAPGEEDAPPGPAPDAASDPPDGAGVDAEAPDTSTRSVFCAQQTNVAFCEDFDEGQVLANWKVTKLHAALTLDTSSWTSTPHSGRIVMNPSPEEQEVVASRELGPQGRIDIELDVRRRGRDEQIFQLNWPTVGYARFDTTGKISLQRTAGTGPAQEVLPHTPSAIPNDFVHVRARIDLVQSRVTYTIDGKSCYDGAIPSTFEFSGEVRFELASYLGPEDPGGVLDMAWDNIVVRTAP